MDASKTVDEPKKTDDDHIWDAYRILESRSMNEDRVWAERNQFNYVTNFFLLFLYVNAQAQLPILIKILPPVGIALDVVMYYFLLMSNRALNRWQYALRQLEESSALNVMTEKKIRPYTDILGKNMWGDKKMNPAAGIVVKFIGYFTAFFAPFMPVIFAVIWLFLWIVGR